jgi:hypothetical protein
MGWIILLAAIAALVYTVRLMLRRIEDRRRASEERAASLLAQVAPRAAVPPKEPPLEPRQVDAQERLLWEAAAKAGEAGEPALAIQLYARLLARYPQTGFAAQAHGAVEALKRKLH